MAIWLENLGFGVYTRQFRSEHVDGKRLVVFTPDTLKTYFPQMSAKHALAIMKQIDILKVGHPIRIFQNSNIFVIDTFNRGHFPKL